MSRRAGRRGWAGARGRDRVRAARAIAAAVREAGSPEPEVGRVRSIGKGLSCRAFAAEVDGGSRTLVALVPRGDSCAPRATDAVEREARLLTLLARRAPGLRVPEPAVAVQDGPERLLVCGFVEGIPVDLRAGRAPGPGPWELVARVAATVHRVSTEGLEWLPGHATRREHGELVAGELADLEDSADPVVRRALAWLRANLPPPEPSALLHGDLLGHNLRYFPGRPPGVIDWEFAQRGDPAYDLAIVTRGVRRPFQVADGMALLLAAYDGALADLGSGSSPLSEPDVRFHEIALHLRWYRRTIAGDPGAEPTDAVLARLRNLVKRA